MSDDGGAAAAAAAAAGASAAAAAEQRRQQQEEEEMTPYTEADLQGGWEFKIVRCNTSAFREPEVLQKVCAEEARAGWQLVEKFDDKRLRFKRPASAKANDASLGVDPYRSQYGIADSAYIGIILACVFGGVLLIVGSYFIGAIALLIGLIGWFTVEPQSARKCQSFLVGLQALVRRKPPPQS